MPNKNKTPFNYPHVAGIKDVFTQSSLHLVWDQLRTHQELTAQNQLDIGTIQTSLANLIDVVNQISTVVNQTSDQVNRTTSHVEGIPLPNTPGGPIVPDPDPGDTTVEVTDTPIPIDMGTVIVEGSPAGAVLFPKTATLLSFGIAPGVMSISSIGTDSWPAVAIDSGPPSQSATLWIFLYISGAWYAAGAERLRPSQTNGTKPEGNPSTVIPVDWLYDSGRWPTMAGYKPYPGQRVGVMLVAGDTRAPGNNTPVMERSNILEINWPTTSGANPCTVIWTEP